MSASRAPASRARADSSYQSHQGIAIRPGYPGRRAEAAIVTDRLHRPDNQRGTSYSRSVAARTRAGVCPSEPCRTTTSHGREGARHGGQSRSRCRSQAPDGCALCGGIGQASAAILAREVFVRSFANRRQLGSYLGLTPSAYDSGSTSRCQGISKAGNSWRRLDRDCLAPAEVSEQQLAVALV